MSLAGIGLSMFFLAMIVASLFPPMVISPCH